MIVDLPNTTVSAISKTLVRLRDEGGAVALGRVLTLVISTDPSVEEVTIDAANAASREHPMRVIVLSRSADADAAAPRLDAQIRIGGDAGASEVIVVRGKGDAGADEESIVTGLLLPDAPVVVWWSHDAPDVPAESPLGRIAQRRITDAATRADVDEACAALSRSHTPGDTDFAWTRVTLWRSQLAAVLDQPPYEPVESVDVVGSLGSPSLRLLGAWLGQQLEAPVTLSEPVDADQVEGIHAVRLHRAGGTIELARISGQTIRLTQPGQPQHEITIPRRTIRECLAEELRRLDPDEVYESVVTRALPVAVSVEG
ncbi:MAG: glucose-6-phosphate dehydrogenase assembly protein OpcA [Microbacteriaceae bacterium]|nr:glucose-6-phosphate dehydrogenase assembly protein OpcA [Microbacteriaceae bacterium]